MKLKENEKLLKQAEGQVQEMVRQLAEQKKQYEHDKEERAAQYQKDQEANERMQQRFQKQLDALAEKRERELEDRVTAKVVQLEKQQNGFFSGFQKKATAEIEQDLGLDLIEDPKAQQKEMMRRLKKQGVDVVKLDTSGSTEEESGKKVNRNFAIGSNVFN